jgi:integrase
MDFAVLVRWQKFGPVGSRFKKPRFVGTEPGWAAGANAYAERLAKRVAASGHGANALLEWGFWGRIAITLSHVIGQRLEEPTAPGIQELFDGLQAAGRDKPMTGSSAAHGATIIAQFLVWRAMHFPESRTPFLQDVADRERRRARNRRRSAILPGIRYPDWRTASEERRPLGVEESRRVASAHRQMRYNLFDRATRAGPRLAEACGLDEADVLKFLPDAGICRAEIEAFLKDPANSEGETPLAARAARRFLEGVPAVILTFWAKGGVIVDKELESPFAADLLAMVIARYLPAGDLPRLEEAVGRPLFLNNRGARVDPGSARRQLKRTAARAGVDGLWPHGGRKEHVNDWVEHNRPRTEAEFMLLADSLGQRDLNMIPTYNLPRRGRGWDDHDRE